MNKDINIHAVGLFLAGVVLVVGGPILIGKGTLELFSIFGAQGWPTTEGVVTRLDVTSKRPSRFGKKKSTVYDIVIRYDYTVDANTHTGDRITLGSTNKNSESYAQQVQRDYAVGNTVDVHYNPDAPAESVLDVAVPLWTWLNILIGVIMLILGVPLTIWVWKNRHHNPDAPAQG